jgi:hypothetical protein
MVNNPTLIRGEKRRIRLANTSKVYLVINVHEYDTNGHTNFDGFDPFSFILKDNKLIANDDLVFYNNLKDKRCIIEELVEVVNKYTENNDIVLLIDIQRLCILDETISVYLNFIETPKKPKTFFGRMFEKKRPSTTPEIYNGEINFHLVDFESGVHLLDGHQIKFSLLNSLLEIKKIDNFYIELYCICEPLDSTIEELIKKCIE